jgi:hypothetical protein
MKINYKKIEKGSWKAFEAIFKVFMFYCIASLIIFAFEILGELAYKFFNLSMVTRTIASVVMGICLYVWWENYSKRKNRSALDKWNSYNYNGKFTKEEVFEIFNELTKNK